MSPRLGRLLPTGRSALRLHASLGLLDAEPSAGFRLLRRAGLRVASPRETASTRCERHWHSPPTNVCPAIELM